MKAGSRVNEACAVLRMWLENAGLKPGARLPSERQIASELGQTHSTMNRAVTRLVAEGLLVREGYKLYSSAVGTSGKPDAPYVFTARRETPRIKITRRVARTLKKKLEIHAWESLESLAYILQRLQGMKISGILFDVPFSADMEKWRPGLENLASAGVPYVCVGQPIDGLTSVSPDYGAALRHAFEYLVRHQHRELALLSNQILAPSIVAALHNWGMECAVHGLDSSRPRVHVGRQHSAREDAAQFAELLSGKWKKVTGVIAHHRAIIPLLIEELAHRNKRVPQDISIVSLGDTLQLRTSTPPVTCLDFDDALQIEMAFRLLDWIENKTSSPGAQPYPVIFNLQPHLVQRGSIATWNSSETPPKLVKENARNRRDEQRPAGPEEMQYRLESIQRRPYALTVGTGDSRFQTIDLGSYLNRPLNYRLGWLGDLPLRNLESGRQRIHGALFNIVNGPARSDYGVVVFRSLTNNTGAGKVLPTRIKVKVNALAKAIYVVHGCGNSDTLDSFATYRFYTKAGVIDSVPMVVLGARPPDMKDEQWNSVVPRANIQDWWPDYFHTDFPSSRHMIVPQDRETFANHRYLYTLEWINPDPMQKIEYVEVQADPKRSTTLGLIAMSALLATPAGR